MGKTSKQGELHYRVKEKVKFREKMSYGIGAMADALIWSSVSAFGTYYYTNSAGLSAAVVGTIFLLSRILDGFSDVFMGILIDKTHTKYGKARPWLLWMAIPYAIAAVLLFSVPQSFSPFAKIIYVFITYNLVSTVCYTAIIQPYATLSTLITDNVRERTHLNIARMGVAMFSSVLISFLVLPIVKAFGDTPIAWTKTFSILGVISAALFMVTFLNTKERLAAATHKDMTKKVSLPIGKALKTLVTNKYWVNRVFFGVVITIASATSGVNIYYASYWLNDKGLIGILSLANVVPMVLSLFLVTAISMKIGKKNTVQIGLGVMLTGLVLQLLAPTSLPLVLVGYSIRGFGTGLAATLLGVMLGDTIDYGEWKNGIRTEGLVFSASNIGTKVGSGLGQASLGWLLAIGGFNAAAAVQSASAMTAIRAVFTFIPLTVAIIAFLLNMFYDLDKKMPQILDDLKERSEKTMNDEMEAIK